MKRCAVLCLFVWTSARIWIHQPRMDEINAGEAVREGDTSMFADFASIQADLEVLEAELAQGHRGAIE